MEPIPATKGHLALATIKTLFDRKISSAELVKNEHIASCERCSEIISVIESAHEIAGTTRPDTTKSHPSRSELSNTISKTYDNSLNSKEAADFLYHVTSCGLCFEYVATVLEELLAPLPEAAEALLPEFSGLSMAEQVMKEYPPSPAIDDNKVPLKKRINEWISDTFDWSPLRAPIAAAALFILLFVMMPGGIYVAFFHNAHSIGDSYVYDTKVPIDPPSGLRGGEPHAEDPEYRKFGARFIDALFNYKDYDYVTTINKLEKEIAQAELLKRKSPDSKTLMKVRDFYFYLGVSHFALSRSQNLKLSDEEITSHNEKAIEYLKEAESITANNNLNKPDREIYFLGLAYGFAGQTDLAVRQLRRIEVESEYYEGRLQLLNEWSQ